MIHADEAMTKRTRRGIAGSVLLVVAVVVGAVIVTALRAEGREHTEADTNDGGAWLLKADQGYIGHVNRAVQELSARISVADAGSVFDTDQAEDVVLVQDRTAGTATMIDDANDRKATTVAGIDGSSTTVDAVDGGVLVYSESALALWRFSRDDFASLETLDGEEPILRGEGPGRSRDVRRRPRRDRRPGRRCCRLPAARTARPSAAPTSISPTTSSPSPRSARARP